jgi:hypothetical protein
MSKYKIDIPKPCHENWQEMTPSQKGRFCASCQKEVIDFTQLSPLEIARKTKSSKNLCGRFTQSQLQQEYVVASQNKLSRLGIALGLGSIIAIAQPSFAQEEQTDKINIYQENDHLQEETTLRTKTSDSISISGTVTDEEGLPLPGVTVIQQNTQNGIQTDFNGNFSIEISKDDFKNDLILEFSYFGFVNVALNCQRIESNQLLIKMKPDSENREVVITGGAFISKPNIFQRFLNLFRSKDNKRYH